MRRTLTSVAAMACLAALLVVAAPAPAPAFPVATNDMLYQAYGRVFPDPHGCVRGLPEKSPWAKGRVCATQFLQWQQVLDGLGFLEGKFPTLLEVVNLREALANDPSFAADELQSAGLPQEDLSRLKSDLYVVKVTDARSPIPERERRHFAYSLSIHGIERAGIEGGIRAIEDLVTWAACEKSAEASPACGFESVSPSSPRKILDAFQPPEGPTAGDVLRKGVVYFVLANPDGWRRGSVTEGGVTFQRYNGNGMDLNRDWPAVGYTQAEYTPASEPETRGFGKYLKKVRGTTAENRFAGAIDLHGMVTSHSFSFTLLGAGQRDYRKNAVTVDTAVTTWRDAESRLTWSPLVARADSCPGPVPEPFFGGEHVPMCTDLWGTVWDTIRYQVTGSFGDWMDAPMGLDAVGIDNEMAYSHLAPDTAFVPDIEQLHVDGNKGLIYAQLAALLDEKRVTYRPEGKIAYVFDPARIRNRGGAQAVSSLASLPAQAAIEHTQPTGIQDFRIDVLGPAEGVHNGGMTIEATFPNVRGNSPDPLVAELILDYCGPGDHPGDEAECREVARYFNQSGTYRQAGARIDLNDPRPGPYRIRSSDDRAVPTEYRVTFSKGTAYPVPRQEPYDVSRMDFFRDLNRYVPAGSKLTAVTVDQILAQPDMLGRFDAVVVAGAYMPGFGARYDGSQRMRYSAALRSFAAGGGSLVLTDAALSGLPFVQPAIKPASVRRGYFFAGWMDFDDGKGPTYARHPLAKGVNKPGASEGFDTLAGVRYDNRHQTYEPVPIGYFVSPRGSGNDACTVDVCDSPNWVVDEQAWKAAGGTVAARTHVNLAMTPPSSGAAATAAGVSLGELKLGKGSVRIAGALLPDPTTKNYHPYGLSSYALTYTGYQVFENLVAGRRSGAPARPAPPKPKPIVRGVRTPLPATGVESGASAAVLLGAMAAAAAIWLRRGRIPAAR